MYCLFVCLFVCHVRWFLAQRKPRKGCLLSVQQLQEGKCRRLQVLWQAALVRHGGVISGLSSSVFFIPIHPWAPVRHPARGQMIGITEKDLKEKCSACLLPVSLFHTGTNSRLMMTSYDLLVHLSKALALQKYLKSHQAWIRDMY